MERRRSGRMAAAWALAMWALSPEPGEAQRCERECNAAERDARSCCPARSSEATSAEDAIASSPELAEAVRHHAEGQRLSRHTIDPDPRMLMLARREYALAVPGYREFLRTHSNSPLAYEIRYDLADALFWSEQYEEAERVYAEVRDSDLSDTFMPESARRVVESLHREVQQAEERGSLHVRSDSAIDAGDPARVSPIDMPPLVQRLFDARETYLSRVPESRDVEHVRRPYQYDNAQLLYWYGRWSDAARRFHRIYDERCSGPDADDTGEGAWEYLRQMAIATQNTGELERLSRDLLHRACTFGRSEPSFANEEERGAYCRRQDRAHDPLCIAIRDLADLGDRRAAPQGQSSPR